MTYLLFPNPLYFLLLLSLLSLLLFSTFPQLALSTNSFSSSSVGHLNLPQKIRLKSPIPIPDASELLIPIHVIPEPISITGSGPPKIISITTPTANHLYGEGEVIFIDVAFTSSVDIVDSPTLLLGTGCHDDSCAINEVQRFTCQADEGKFSLTFAKQDAFFTSINYDLQYIDNIPVDITLDQFKVLLETLNGINRVTVHYSDSDDRAYSYGNRICTSRGNIVTITFEDVDSDVGVNGNIPELTFDMLNSPLNPRTYLEGGDGSILSARLSAGIPSLSETAIQIVQGVKHTDREAAYFSGSGSSIITLRYQVLHGDFTDDLEVKSLLQDSTRGFIFKTQVASFVGSLIVPIDTDHFPTNKRSERYLESRGSSLGFSHDIQISTVQPKITSVDPMNNVQLPGTFGEGEEIFLSTTFDAEVVVFYPDSLSIPYIWLETGVIKRKAFFHGPIDPSFPMIINWKYVVVLGDVSADLDYIVPSDLGVSALIIPPGSYIRRASTFPTTDVSLVLPIPSLRGSLTYTGNMVINTEIPFVVSVMASTDVSRLADNTGVDGLVVGDEVYINLQFDYPITITGVPRIHVQTTGPTPVPIDSIVETSEDAVYSFDSTLAKANAVVSLTFNIDLNVGLQNGETIQFQLPHFGDIGEDGTLSGASISSLSMLAENTILSTPLPIIGAWDATTDVITLTATDLIDHNRAPSSLIATYPSAISFKIIVYASNGIRSPPQGIRKGANGEAGIFMITDASDGAIQAPPLGEYTTILRGIGIASSSIKSFTPVVAGEATSIVILFSTTGPVQQNDQVRIYLPNFNLDASLGPFGINNVAAGGWHGFPLSAAWDDAHDILTINQDAHFAAGASHEFSIEGLAISSLGLAPNAASMITIELVGKALPTSVQVSPAVGIISNPFITFGTSAVVAPILNTAVPYTFAAEIGPGGMAVGDTIVVQTPFIAAPASSITMEVYDSSSSVSVSTNWSAQFTSSPSTITFTSLLAQAGTFNFAAFIPSSVNLILISTPVLHTSSYTMEIVSALSPVSPAKIIVDSLTPVGAFVGSPVINFLPKTVDSASFYDLDFSFTMAFDIAVNDEVYFVLPFFTGTAFLDTALVGGNFEASFNQAVTVTSGATTYDCSVDATRCLKIKFISTFSANTLIQVSILNTQVQISIPLRGVSQIKENHGIVAFLQAVSSTIYIPEQVTNNQCTGVCESSITYSSPHSNSASSIGLTFTISAAIQSGDTFTFLLPGFLNTDVANLNFASGGVNFAASWTLSTTTLLITATGATSADTQVSLSIQSGQIGLPVTPLAGPSCITDGITLTTDADVWHAGSSNTQLSGFVFSCAARKLPGVFSATSFLMSTSLVPSTETQLSMLFTPADFNLEINDNVIVTAAYGFFGDLITPPKTLTITGVDGTSFSGTVSATSTTTTITLVTGFQITAGASVAIALSTTDTNFIVPAGGVSTTLPSFKITSDVSSRYWGHGPFDFNTISSASAIIDSSVDIYAPASFQNGAIDVTLGFQLSNTVLSTGSRVTFYFNGFDLGTTVSDPYFECVTSAAAGCDATAFRVEVDAANERLHFEALRSIPSAATIITYKVTLETAGGGLVLPPTGLLENSNSLQIGLSNVAGYPDVSQINVITSPCVGICDAKIDFDVAIPGEIAALIITIETSALILLNDEVTLDLATIIGAGPASAGSFTLDPVFDSSSFTATYGGFASNLLVLTCTSALNEMSYTVQVSRVNELRIHADGSAANFQFPISAISATTFGSMSVSSAPSSVQPVGKALFSNIIYDQDNTVDKISQKVTANQFTALHLRARFSSILAPGEQVMLYMPDFTSTETVLSLESSGDYTASWSSSSSAITFTLNPTAAAIPANTELSVTVANGQIRLPLNGVKLDSRHLMISTNAVDGPVVAADVQDSPHIGSLVSSSIEFYRGLNATAGGRLDSSNSGNFVAPGVATGLVIQMSFSSTLALNDYIDITLPGFTLADQVIAVGSYEVWNDDDVLTEQSVNLGDYTGSWVQSSGILSLRCEVAAGCVSTVTQPITIDVFESNGLLAASQGFLAGGPVAGFKVSTRSSSVPIFATRITVVDGIGFQTSQVSYTGNPTYVAAGDSARLTFAFTLSTTMQISSGDVIVCRLPSFTVPSTLTLIEAAGFESQLDAAVTFGAGDELRVIANHAFTQATPIAFSVDGLNLPSVGITTTSVNSIICGAESSAAVAFDFLSETTSSPVGHFVASSLSFNPRNANQATSITLSFAANSVIEVGEKVTVALPLFTLAVPGQLVQLQSSTPVQFSIQFSATNLILTALDRVASEGAAITLVVNGLKLPSDGISLDSALLAVSSNLIAGPVTKPTAILSTIGVGKSISQTLAFAPAELVSVIRTGGDGTRFRLRTGSSLNPADFLNTVLMINGQALTVVSIENDILITQEAYTGSPVYSASPSTQLFRSGYRPADYYSGSESEIIVFRYIVQPGDVSSDLSMSSFTDIDLNGATMLRTSTTPTTAVSTVLPDRMSTDSLMLTSALRLDTVEPQVLSVTTTKREGNYAVPGEKIDFIVHFDRQVAILRPHTPSLDAPEMPVLALNVVTGDNTIRFAEYSAGSGTSQITFVYTIQEGDKQGDLGYFGASAITTVYGENVGYIMTHAVNLLQKADTVLPLPGQPGSFDTIHSIQIDNSGDTQTTEALQSIFPSVRSVTALTSDGTYGVGQGIDFLVTFTDQITVNLPLPFIVMDVEAPVGQQRTAVYVANSSAQTLIFRYTVQAGDSSSDLEYKCTCEDFYSTTYIEKNGGSIVDTIDNAKEADYTLPSPDDAGSLSLAKSSNIIIDTSAPYIMSVTSAKLNGVYGIGESIDIIVTFSSAVFVAGSPRLLVNSEGSTFARYRSGNATQFIVFEYIVASENLFSVSDLALDDVAMSIDLNNGAIKRFSHNPITDAVLSLSASGRSSTLGFNRNVVIDTSEPTIQNVDVGPEIISYFNTFQTIDVVANSRNVTEGKFRMTYNKIETTCMDYNATAETVQDALEATGYLVTQVTTTELEGYRYYGEYALRYTIMLFGPSAGIFPLGVSFEGCEEFACTKFNGAGNPLTLERGCLGLTEKPTFVFNRDINVPSGTVDLTMKLTQPVVVTGAPMILLETGNHDAVAVLAPPRIQYVDVGVNALSPLSYGEFQVSYGYYQTNCIQFDAAHTVGAGSMYNRLLEIPEVSAAGIDSISKEVVGNGFRFKVTFSSHAVIKQLLAVDLTPNSVCHPLVPSEARVRIPDKDDLSFRYVTSRGSRLVLKAKSTILVGLKEVLVDASYGVLSPMRGIGAGQGETLAISSVSTRLNILSHKPAQYATVSKMGSFSRTSISFSPRTLNTIVGVTVSFALNVNVAIGEKVSFHFPGFVATCPGAHPAPCPLTAVSETAVDHISNFVVSWILPTDLLELEATAEFAAGTQVVFSVSSMITTPAQAIFADVGAITVSTDAVDGPVTDSPVEDHDGLGISAASVSFVNARAGQKSDLVLTFAPTEELAAGASFEFVLSSFVAVCASAATEFAVTIVEATAANVGYDGDYFAASFVCASATLRLVSNRVLQPRLHQVVLSGLSGTGIFLPNTGFYRGVAGYDINVALDLTSGGTAIVLPTSLGVYPFSEFQPNVGAINMAASSIVFSRPTASERTAITFVISAYMDIERNEAIIFKLPNFKGQNIYPASFSLSGTDAASFRASWIEETATLSLIPQAKLTMNIAYTVTVDLSNRIALPYSGFAGGDELHDYGEVTVECDAEAGRILPSRIEEAFSVPSIGAFMMVKFHGDAYRIDEFTSISLEFEGNSVLDNGDSILLHLPGFVCPTSTLVLESFDSSLFSATWSFGSSEMTVNVRPFSEIVTRPGKDWHILVAISNECKIPVNGLLMNDKSLRFQVTSTNSPITEWTPIQMSTGVGFTHSDLAFYPGVSGNNVYNEIRFNYIVTQMIKVGEVIELSLPGFTKLGATTTVESLLLNGDDASKYTALWYSASSILKLTIMEVIIPQTNIVSIDVSNQMILPPAGILQNTPSAPFFTLRINDAAGNPSADGGLGPIESVVIRHVQGVGTVLQSQVTFDPVKAGEISQVKLLFQLNNRLSANEWVEFTLPDVVSDSPLTDMEIFEVDVATSVSTYTLSTVFSGHYFASTNVIRLTALSLVASQEVVHVYATINNNLRVPIGGHLVNDASYLIATNAGAGPVLIPASVLLSPGIGALISSSLVFTSPDLSLFSLAVSLTFNSVLENLDFVMMTLPSFVGTANIADYLHNLATGTLYTISWDHTVDMVRIEVNSPTSTFNFILASDANIALPVGGIIAGANQGFEITVNSAVVPIAAPTDVAVTTGIGIDQASLTYSDPISSTITAVTVSFRCSVVIEVGETLTLNLAGFTGGTGTIALTATEMTFTSGHLFTGSLVNHNAVTLTVAAQDIQAGVEVTLVLDKALGITLPQTLAANDVSLQITTNAAALGAVLPLAAIPTSPAIGSFTLTALTYGSIASGLRSSIAVDFTIQAALLEGEIVYFDLKDFGGESVDSLVLSGTDNAAFSGVWIEGDSILSLTAVADQMSGRYQVAVDLVNGIILPPTGLTLNDNRLKIYTNAIAGSVPPISILSSPAVGAFLTSSIKFNQLPTTLLPVDLSLSFSISGDLAINERVKIVMKGYRIDTSDATRMDYAHASDPTKQRYTLNPSYDDTTTAAAFATYSLHDDNDVLLELSGANADTFVGYYNEVDGSINFIATTAMSAMHIVTITVSDDNAIYFPIEGVIENDPGFVISTTSIAAPSSTTGPVVSVETVEPVGVISSSLSFTQPRAGDVSEIAFTFNLTCPLQINDVILLNFTEFNSGNNFNMIVKGHDGSYGWLPAFKASWDNGAAHFDDVLRVTALRGIPEVTATVIISMDNNMTLPVAGILEAQEIDFEVQAACLGRIQNQEASVVPTIGSIAPNSLILSHLTPGRATALDIKFTLLDELRAGEELLLHMEGFSYSGGTSFLDDGVMVLTGPSASLFDAVWTNGDVSNDIGLQSLNPVTLGPLGAILRASTNPSQNANLLLPNTVLSGTSAIDTTSPPFIKTVYCISGPGPHYLGALMVFNVEFSDIVIVDTSGVLSLNLQSLPSLNILVGDNRRLAHYKYGSGTDTLVFSLTAIDGDVDTNIRIAGKYALLSNECKFVKTSMIVRANSTISPPYDNVARGGTGGITPVPLIANALKVAVVLSVSTSKSDGTYLAGEVIDIDVTFDATVKVIGFPYLTLRSGTGGRIANARYQKGSKSQVVQVGVDLYGGSDRDRQFLTGGYILEYGGVKTECIDWDTASGRSDGLKERLEEIPAISAGGGILSVTKSLMGNGNSFTVVFALDNADIVTYDQVGSVIYCEHAYTSDGERLYDYVDLPWSEIVSFRYTVEEDDADADLEYDGIHALVANAGDGAFIKASTSRAQSDASLLLPVPGAANSLSASHALVISGGRASISSVSTTSTGTIGVGVFVDITLTYSVNVQVIGVPSISMNSNIIQRYAYYLAGSNSNAITFRYVIDYGDDANPLDFRDINSLILPDTDTSINSFSTLSNLPSILTLPTLDGIGTANVIVSATYRAQVLRTFTDEIDGLYSAGDVISVFVEFTRPVTLSLVNNAVDSIVLTLDVGGSANVVYSGGSGTNILAFAYTVSLSEASSALDTSSLTLTGAMTLIDIFGNIASAAFDPSYTTTLSALHTIEIDSTTPTVSFIGFLTESGTYSPGDIIEIYVEFTRRVHVIGTPTILLYLDDRFDDQLAIYQSGSGTNTLIFTYFVPNADIALGTLAPSTPALNYFSSIALAQYLNGSSILLSSDAPQVDVNPLFPILALSNLTDTSETIVAISSNIPRVIQVTSNTPSGAYGVGELIDIELVFDAKVLINGTGTLLMDTASLPGDYAYAVYISGNTTNTLVFRYEVREGDVSSALDVIDTRNPPFNINVPASLAFVVNDVQFCPLAPLPSVGQPAVVVMRYSDDPVITVDYSIPLPGSVGSLSNDRTIQIKTLPPSVSKVWTTHVNGTYGIGEEIPIYVTFDTRILVSGVPMLEMRTNNIFGTSGFYAIAREAVYTSGSGSDTLLFTYIVTFGDISSALDYVTTSSLKVSNPSTLHSSTPTYIRGFSSTSTPITDADLTLPPPGLKPTVISPSSIVGSYHRLSLQTTGLKIDDVTSTLIDGMYSWGTELDIILTLSGPVLVTGIPQIEMDLPLGGRAHYQPAAASSSVGSNYMTFRYVSKTADVTLDLGYVDRFSLIMDDGTSIVSSVNEFINAVQTLPEPGGEGSLRFNKDILLAGTKPKVIDVFANHCDNDGGNNNDPVIYGVGEEILISLIWDQSVKVLQGSPQLLLSSGGYADYLLTPFKNELIFTYTVLEGDTSFDLDFVNSIDALVLDFDSIVSDTEVIVLLADESLPSSGSPGSLSYNCNIIIDTAVATVTSIEMVQDDGTYRVGDSLSFAVYFSAPVYVIGDVTLELSTGSLAGVEYAHFLSGGNGMNQIILKYVVTVHAFTSDFDYTSRSALSFDVTQIDPLGNAVNGVYRASTNPSQSVDLTLPAKGSIGSLGRSSDVILDSNAPYIIQVSTSKPPGTYSVGEVFTIHVTFNTPVTVTTTPGESPILYLNANAGNNAEAPALYTGGSGTSLLTFAYTSKTTDVTSALDFVCTGFCVRSSSDSTLTGLRNPAAFHVNGKCGIRSASDTGVCANVVLPSISALHLLVAGGGTIEITPNPPRVVNVNVVNAYSAWGYGVGEEIRVSVTFDYKVHVESGVGGDNVLAKVSLKTQKNDIGLTTTHSVVGGQTQTGDAIYESGSGTNTLIFMYTVQPGDSIGSLDYTSSEALSGDIRFSSTTSTSPAVLTLPLPLMAGSISYNKRVSIDTSVPFVESVIPLKHSGDYVTGETIVIIVRFNLPIAVTGVPALLLNVETSVSGGGGAAYAYYDSTWLSNIPHDVNFDFYDTDLICVYTLSEGDRIDSLNHAGIASLTLPSSSSIKRKSTTPSVANDVSLTLRSAMNHERSEGRVDGQWMQFYAKKVQVVLRDLWHEDGRDLEVSLVHGNFSVLLFNGQDGDSVSGDSGSSSSSSDNGMKTFGEPQTFHASLRHPGLETEPLSSTPSSTPQQTNLHTSHRHLNGLGYDYIFSDIASSNIALLGVARQSSTGFNGHADLAIDGGIDGVYGRGSVTHTGAAPATSIPVPAGTTGVGPWWDVTLTSSTYIGGIRIWNRQFQQARDEVQVIAIVAPGKEPSGTFTLQIVLRDGSTVTSGVMTVGIQGSIADGGSESMESYLQSMTSEIGRVEVVRQRETEYEGFYRGYSYVITFVTYIGDINTLTVGTFTKPETPDGKIDIEVVRNGSDNEDYNYKNKHISTRYVNDVFPFWVVVFDDTIDPITLTGTFDEMLHSSGVVWFEEVTLASVKSTRVVTLSPGVSGRYIKIVKQRRADNAGVVQYLSLAEVQVYASEVTTLSTYTGGSPVSERAITQPYVAEEALSSTFDTVQYGGIWNLIIKDRTAYSNSRASGKFEERNGYGSISDFILVITDHTNSVKRYYVDVKSKVKTLPKYGELYIQDIDKNKDDFTRFNGLPSTTKINSMKSKERKLGACYGIDTTGLNGVSNGAVGQHRYCPLNFGVGPVLTTQRSGSGAEELSIGNERNVYYRPFFDFLGVDHFTFVNDFRGVEGGENNVHVHVRNCRRYVSETSASSSVNAVNVHRLCACQRTEENLFGDDVQCPTNIQSICSASSSSSGSGSDGIYSNICVTCTQSNVSLFTATCKTELQKGVAHLTARGICSANSNSDSSSSASDNGMISENTCKEESTSKLPREPYIAYGGAGRGGEYWNGGVGGSKVKSHSQIN